MSFNISPSIKKFGSSLIQKGFKSLIPRVGDAALRLTEVMNRKGLPSFISQQFLDKALTGLSNIDTKKIATDISNLAVDEGTSLAKKGLLSASELFKNKLFLPLAKKFKMIKNDVLTPDRSGQLRVDEGNPRLKHDWSNTYDKINPEVLEGAVSRNNPLVYQNPLPAQNSDPIFNNDASEVRKKTVRAKKKVYDDSKPKVIRTVARNDDVAPMSSDIKAVPKRKVTTVKSLRAEAAKLNIPGRSKMNKKQLLNSINKAKESKNSKFMVAI